MGGCGLTYEDRKEWVWPQMGRGRLRRWRRNAAADFADYADLSGYRRLAWRCGWREMRPQITLMTQITAATAAGCRRGWGCREMRPQITRMTQILSGYRRLPRKCGWREMRPQITRMTQILSGYRRMVWKELLVEGQAGIFSKLAFICAIRAICGCILGGLRLVCHSSYPKTFRWYCRLLAPKFSSRPRCRSVVLR